jgi:hypothetical protein
MSADVRVPTIYDRSLANARALIKRGTARSWGELDPVLRADELGYETDTDRFKLGDGETRYSALPYYVREPMG